MPHVAIQLSPGRSERQKERLAAAIVEDVVRIACCGEEAVSVSIEEVAPEDWAERVYRTEIVQSQGKLYKKPGYSM